MLVDTMGNPRNAVITLPGGLPATVTWTFDETEVNIFVENTWAKNNPDGSYAADVAISRARQACGLDDAEYVFITG